MKTGDSHRRRVAAALGERVGGGGGAGRQRQRPGVRGAAARRGAGGGRAARHARRHARRHGRRRGQQVSGYVHLSYSKRNLVLSLFSSFVTLLDYGISTVAMVFRHCASAPR